MQEELNALLGAVAQGSEHAFTCLSEIYAPLVHSMSVQFASSFTKKEGIAAVGVQDLEQEAYLALFRAATSYNAAQKNVSFGLYAKICIRNALISLLRKCRTATRLEKTTPGAKKIFRDADVSFFSGSDCGEAGKLKEQIEQVLSPYEKTVFEQYISGKSVKSISLSVGKTEKSVSNAVYRIRVKIRGLLDQ